MQRLPLLRLVVLLKLLETVAGFGCLHPTCRSGAGFMTHPGSFLSAGAFEHSEYAILEDDDSDVEEAKVVEKASADFISIQLPEEDDVDEEEMGPQKSRPEYAALPRGTVLQIQVGDIALARKAWKKRRRTGSPLLVPCSVLNVNRRSMVRWNLMFLLEKFGSICKNGISISQTKVARSYRDFLQSSLQKQALALGYETNRDMLLGLFDDEIQESYGVRLIDSDDGKLSLQAPISRQKAQARAAQSPLLQFRLPKPEDHGDMDTLTHTGHIKARQPNSSDRSYNFLPLSAALRVSQKEDVDSGRIEEGSTHAAVVFDFDPIGDGGSPLLTLALDPRGAREALKLKPDHLSRTPVHNPTHEFHQLSAGAGPFKAKVVRMLRGKALIDMDVGRKVSSTGEYVKVLGTLRYLDSVDVLDKGSDEPPKFDPYDISTFVDDDAGTIDAIEDALAELDEDDDDDDEKELHEAMDNLDDEDDDDDDDDFPKDVQMTEEETTFLTTNEDGSLTYLDPDDGEEIVIEKDDEDFEDMMMVKEQIEKALGKSSDTSDVQREHPKEGQDVSKTPTVKPRLARKIIQVGDEIDVYIRSTSKQSGQFTVSTNPVIAGKKAKDIKKDSVAYKKLQRLKKSMGGSLKAIWNAEGRECEGSVKATSNTGGFLYVQPDLEGFPVGIATISEDMGDFSQGDNIRVRIAGVDEERGQLALKVVQV